MKQITENRIDLLVADLCEEIDELKLDRDYWKKMYIEERDARSIEMNDRLKDSQKGVANALMLALCVKDNPDGSLTISNEDRKQLAENIKN